MQQLGTQLGMELVKRHRRCEKWGRLDNTENPPTNPAIYMHRNVTSFCFTCQPGYGIFLQIKQAKKIGKQAQGGEPKLK